MLPPPQFTDPVPIGDGGFGDVWRAMAPGGIEVAVKMPNSLDENTVARFRREVTIQSSLSHDNIAELLDFDLSVEEPWCIMPLAVRDFWHYLEDPTVLPESILEVLRQIVAGVSFAHANNVLHRDLKPANVLMYVKEGEPWARVADFGLSRRLTRAEMTFQTATGEAFGSTWFMAPEQPDRFPDMTVTGDIFSMGRIIEFCLINRSDLRAAYPGLARCVDVATRHNEFERYQRTTELQDAIELATAKPGVLQRPIDYLRDVASSAMRNPEVVHPVSEIMLILESQARDHEMLRSMFSILPYVLVDLLAAEHPGQLRAVLRAYTESLTDALPVDQALRARNLLDHCLTNLKDRVLRGIALAGLVLLAATYEMEEFAEPASEWLGSESDLEIVAEVASEIDRHPSVLLWLQRNVSPSRLPPVLAERISRG